jgi:uncharacterized protein (TIGR03067 family)
MKNTLLTMLSVGILASGCSKAHKPDSVALQGTWSGQEAGARTPGSSSLLLDGTKCEFHGADPQEWYKATYSIREDTTPKQLEAVITECPFPQYVGKTVHGIYKIEDGKFTFTANEPGNPAAPASFDAQAARKFVLTRKP